MESPNYLMNTGASSQLAQPSALLTTERKDVLTNITMCLEMTALDDNAPLQSPITHPIRKYCTLILKLLCVNVKSLYEASSKMAESVRVPLTQCSGLK